MTAQEFAYACLDYIGEFSLTLTEYTTPADAGVMRAIARAGNEALEAIFALNPQLFKREVGVTVLAPQTGTVAVTQGSTAVSATSFTTALAGNTLLIAGQSEYNALRTEGADKKLSFPYTGSTGTKTATLYGDAILLDSAYSRPLGPVWLSDIRMLAPLNGRAAALGYDPRQDLDSDWGLRSYGFSRSPAARTVGQPEAYFADTHLLTAGTSQIRIFLAPLPDAQSSLRFEAAVKPEPVTVANLGSQGTDPARNFPLPAGCDARFLLPLWLYYWSRSAFFKDPTARQQIARDRAEVLPEIEAWRVQPQTGGHIVTSGWR